MTSLERAFRTNLLGQIAKARIQQLLFNVGYEIRKLTPHDLTTIDRIRNTEIETVIDVGANQGQYARRMRALGFSGTIISFEPYSRAYSILKASARKDENWILRNQALGATHSQATLHISANSVSSSLREQTALHLAADETAAETGLETTQVSTLDSELQKIGANEPYWLKIDTQGYEAEVLEGAGRALERTLVLELELSTRELYRGQTSYTDLLSMTGKLGFVPVSIRRALVDPLDGTILQLDVILRNLNFGSVK